ncbi:unnamed protein product [Nesidiocoris tenuis]|uniref:Uncharacterized protein n=1 Tax=Nesidiocoris tenuis TaxID=355587 RepID=A0A6H5GFW7_9HEMI|nr:unnamed protein product [Nesidiocoris tenuis]CAB0001943.1 unnamed protein product [Nesidiocoris tenuis]
MFCNFLSVDVPAFLPTMTYEDSLLAPEDPSAMKAEFVTILMAAAVSGSTMSMYLIREDQYCLTEDESPYVQFSTQTSYQVARNRKPVVPVPSE